MAIAPPPTAPLPRHHLLVLAILVGSFIFLFAVVVRLVFVPATHPVPTINIPIDTTVAPPLINATVVVTPSPALAHPTPTSRPASAHPTPRPTPHPPTATPVPPTPTPTRSPPF